MADDVVKLDPWQTIIAVGWGDGSSGSGSGSGSSGSGGTPEGPLFFSLSLRLYVVDTESGPGIGVTCDAPYDPVPPSGTWFVNSYTTEVTYGYNLGPSPLTPPTTQLVSGGLDSVSVSVSGLPSGQAVSVSPETISYLGFGPYWQQDGGPDHPRASGGPGVGTSWKAATLRTLRHRADQITSGQFCIGPTASSDPGLGAPAWLATNTADATWTAEAPFDFSSASFDYAGSTYVCTGTGLAANSDRRSTLYLLFERSDNIDP